MATAEAAEAAAHHEAQMEPTSFSSRQAYILVRRRGAMRKYIYHPDDEMFDGWTVQQLEAYLRARSAHLNGRRADMLER